MSMIVNIEFRNRLLPSRHDCLSHQSRQRIQQGRQLLSIVCVFLACLAPTSDALAMQKKYYGGAGVGRLVLDDVAAVENAWKCHYDMVLCERLQTRVAKTDTGLFVPQDDLPRLHLCRVLSLGPGREEENGRVTPMPSNLRIGDVVVAKNPWGIGPKDEETADGKKLSYMRIQDIAAVITGGLAEDGEQ